MISPSPTFAVFLFLFFLCSITFSFTAAIIQFNLYLTLILSLDQLVVIELSSGYESNLL